MSRGGFAPFYSFFSFLFFLFPLSLSPTPSSHQHGAHPTTGPNSEKHPYTSLHQVHEAVGKKQQNPLNFTIKGRHSHLSKVTSPLLLSPFFSPFPCATMACPEKTLT